MPDRDVVIKGLENLWLCVSPVSHSCGDCPERDNHVECKRHIIQKTLTLLRDQEPRVMTLEEVIKHYSLPPVFVDDLGAQEDYLQDITPLYFDFPEADSFAVHWRGYYSVRKYLDDWKASYGEKWRCWTGRPTDEQRGAVKWDADGA